MTPKEEAIAREQIVTQLAMCPTTIQRMREAGLHESRELQLDFTFFARSHDDARNLAGFLKDNDCLEVAVTSRGIGFFRKYCIEGKTPPTLVSEEILTKWIMWMVVQGVLRNCEFDGWGAEIP